MRATAIRFSELARVAGSYGCQSRPIATAGAYSRSRRSFTGAVVVRMSSTSSSVNAGW
jgi:hypothetical protein